jgi:hypothetical protein
MKPMSEHRLLVPLLAVALFGLRWVEVFSLPCGGREARAARRPRTRWTGRGPQTHRTQASLRVWAGDLLTAAQVASMMKAGSACRRYA